MTLSLRDIKRTITEQTIVEKALALFKERGFAQVSVRQIAKAAVVSEKTVFNYFPYKELIVVAGLHPTLAAFMAEIQQQVDAIADPTQVLRHFGQTLAAICAAQPEAAGMALAEMLSSDSSRLALAMRYLPDLYGPIRTVMTLARAQGRLRPEVSVEYATDFFLTSVLNIIRTHLALGRAEQVRANLDVMLEIFLFGAFSPSTPSSPSQGSAP